MWGLHLNFVECKSFHDSNSPDILALFETNLDASIDSGNFCVKGYLPLIWKHFVTYMHGLAVYMKGGLPFARDLSLENSPDSYLCFWLALLHLVSYFSFLNWSPSSSSCTVFNVIDKSELNNSASNNILFWYPSCIPWYQLWQTFVPEPAQNDSI